MIGNCKKMDNDSVTNSVSLTPRELDVHSAAQFTTEMHRLGLAGEH